VRRAVRRQKSC